MSRRVLPFFAIAVLTVMTFPAWAKSSSSESLKADITLDAPAALNNATLAAGEYKVVAEGNQAKFEQDGKIVAEVPCTWKTLSNKSRYSAVELDRDRITGIDFSGKTQAIQFSTN